MRRWDQTFAGGTNSSQSGMGWESYLTGRHHSVFVLGTHLASKELLPIALACFGWGEKVVRGKGALSQWQYGSCGDLKMVTVETRSLYICCVLISEQYGVELQAAHLPGSANSMADALSFNDYTHFLCASRRVIPPSKDTSISIIPSSREDQPNWTSRRWFTNCTKQVWLAPWQVGHIHWEIRVLFLLWQGWDPSSTSIRGETVLFCSISL